MAEMQTCPNENSDLCMEHYEAAYIVRYPES